MKTLYSIFFSFITLASFAQVGDVVKNEQWTQIGVVNVPLVGYSVKLEKHPTNEAYVLSYQDRNYKKIREVKQIFFNATNAELSKLHDAILSAFELNKKETMSMKLGDKDLILGKYMGSVAVHVDNGGWFWIAKGELNKLFGTD